MSAKDLGSRLDRVYGARNLDDLRAEYDQWAQAYDDDVARLGYLLRAVSVGYICRHVEQTGRILDAGAGTGLVGSYLQILGFNDLTAIDMSEGMLGYARQRGCYREVRQMVLGERLDFPTASFDGAYAVGVFTEGHAPPHAFTELIRVIRPGGRVVFSIRDDVYRSAGYRERQEKLARSSKWRLIEVSPKFQPYPKAKPALRSRVFVYEVAS